MSEASRRFLDMESPIQLLNRPAEGTVIARRPPARRRRRALRQSTCRVSPQGMCPGGGHYPGHARGHARDLKQVLLAAGSTPASRPRAGLVCACSVANGIAVSARARYRNAIVGRPMGGRSQRRSAPTALWVDAERRGKELLAVKMAPVVGHIAAPFVLLARQQHKSGDRWLTVLDVAVEQVDRDAAQARDRLAHRRV